MRPDPVGQVEAILAAHDHGHYSGNSGVPRRWVNAYVLSTFFVGIIRAQSLGWLLEQLRAIAAIPASDDDNDRGARLVLRPPRRRRAG
jgi:hypothetical protein